MTPEPRIRRYVGDLRQVARIDRLVREDGAARGSRLLRLVTGGGLEVELLPDRGLDVGAVTIDGVPVAWQAPTPAAGPERFEPSGAGWLRTFAGGLLTTCGLDTFGAASVDDGIALGQHGRATSLAAEHLSSRVPELDDDPPVLEVVASMRQAVLFGENLAWRRTVSADLGGRELRIVDRVANLGARPAPHLVLYHVNFGWPLLAPGARLSADPAPREVRARDADSATGREHWQEAPEPAGAEAPEQVLAHRLPTPGRVAYRLENAAIGLAATLSIDSAELPWLYQWRLFREREYVLALEPATADAIEGRAEARARGAVPILAPGEARQTSLAIGFDRLT